jgi:hypothetical protein
MLTVQAIANLHDRIMLILGGSHVWLTADDIVVKLSVFSTYQEEDVVQSLQVLGRLGRVIEKEGHYAAPLVRVEPMSSQ